MSRGDDGGSDFREFARRYSIAERCYQNRMHTGGDVEFAMSMRQAIENEFKRCFISVKRPDWDAVAKAAAGEEGVQV